MSNEINFFGKTTFRGEKKRFGIRLDDRRKHVYIIGKTGMGKTVLMENMAIQDIQNGHGVCFIDPHGEAAEKLLDFVPSSRINDVVYFNPGDVNYPIAFNVMEKVGIEHRHLVASGLLAVFKKIWPDVWSARMEYILNNAILALLEYPGSTLLGINRMLADTDFRKRVVEKITDPVIKAFWTKEFARYTQRYEVEATAAIQNKIGQFISAPLIRNVVGQIKSSLNMRELMDEEKILIVNLSRGKVGDDVSLLLGGLVITKLQLAAMSRVNIPEEERKDFFLYVDEFQHFATRAFTGILSEARKYRFCLTLGHQYISQMEEEVRDAVFGNVGTIVSFRVGAEDAEYLEKEFHPEFEAGDIVNLAKYNVYLKLMIDGVAGRAFSAETLLPISISEKSSKDKIIKVSRERYATEKEKVEEKIQKWLGFLESIEGIPMAPLLHDARCDICGKETKITFVPDGKRPIFCKSCLKKRKRGELSVESLSPEKETEKTKTPVPISLKEAGEKEPVFFSPSKRKEQKEKAAVDTEKVRAALKSALKKTEGEKEEVKTKTNKKTKKKTKKKNR